MKTKFSIILFLCCFLCFNSCEKESNKKGIEEISACGVTHPEKNLPWLAELIAKAKNDKTGNYFGRIWLEKYKEQDIFVTEMMFGSGAVMYWFLDCSGNHFISRNEDEGYCPSAFIGEGHFYVEDEEDFSAFIRNMKLDIVIYSPF